MKKDQLFNISPGNSKNKIFRLIVTILLVVQSGLYAQNIEVKGVVKSIEDPTISGAYVLLKGTNTGTVTDSKGSYSITVPQDGTLAFSFIGYLTEEIPVEGRSVIDVTLIENIESLDEVVVVGYGTQRKSDLTLLWPLLSQRILIKCLLLLPTRYYRVALQV